MTEIHGRTLVDDYFWLRAKADPEALAYLEAEDRYADTVMAPLAPLVDSLYREMLGHIQETDSSVPYREGPAWYYTRTETGRQYPILCRRRGSLDAPEEVILDQNALAVGTPFLAIGAAAVSDDGRLLAYSVDRTGYRQFTLQVKDIRSGALLPCEFERVTSVAWAADNRTLFYVTEDPVTKRSDALFRHVLGSGASTLVYDERDELFDLVVSRSRDGVLVFLEADSKTSSETRFVPAADPAAPLRLVAPREPLHEYDVAHRHGALYIRTNRGAKNFRVVTAPLAAPDPANWTEFVPHRPNVKIEHVDVFAGHVALTVWEQGLEHIEVLDPATGSSRRITFPEPVYTVSVGPNREFDTTRLRYTYESLSTPPSVFECDMTTFQTECLKETPVPGGFDREAYVTRREWAAAPDGVRVPVSVVSRAGVPLDGSAPLLLYAYGSYGLSIPPAFSAARLPLLDRGVVYAIAHIRGGGELGEPWRDEGRMLRKLNTFSDFIASAEHLIGRGYTSPDRLVMQGGSAGGMLVAGVANMRPELFAAAIVQVPFVDVLNTMLDPTLPLTTSEYIEWGNPNEGEAFEYMAQYSPYDNVRAQAYPAMLVRVSTHDSQVPYWEGAKLVARLRAMKTDDRPLLLKVNFAAGHGGASGRYDALREAAFNTAFVLWQMGLAGTADAASAYTLQERGTNSSSNSETA
jgi:oligopeptidase B